MLKDLDMVTVRKDFRQKMNLFQVVAQSTGTVECNDCIYAEW